MGIYNNIVDGATYAFALTQVNNSIFKNNIITNVEGVFLDTEWSGGGGGCFIGVQPSKDLVFDYNIYHNYNLLYVDDGDMGFVDGGNNLVGANPKFRQTGNRPFSYYELQPGPALDSGLDLSAIFATDAKGTTRPQGPAWDREPLS